MELKRIESFCVDHLKLLPGIYVSRKDEVGNTLVTTFDLRFIRPNFELSMTTAGIHTIEHLGATYLRNREDIKSEVVYFGPMGCRTGFYLILKGDKEPEDIKACIKDMLDFIIKFEGDIPGATAVECGNYLDNNLMEAKIYAKKYREIL